MSCNLGTIIAGPAVLTYKRKTFYSKADITVRGDIETFLIEVDAFGGPVQEREANAPLGLSFVPAGEFENLDVLWPYGNPVIGGSIVAVTPVTAVDAGADTLTVTNHRLTNGAPVRAEVVDGTIVVGLTAGTLYYANVVNANTISLHVLQADALAGTTKIAVSAGTGETRIIEQEPLIIQSVDGKLITFHVAAVSQMPDFIGSAVQSIIGEVSFEIFRKNGVPAATADSRFSIAANAFAVDTTFDPDAIITQPYTGTWGAAPWDSFSSKNGFRASFAMGLAAIEDDACGVIGRRLTSVRAQVSGQPTNATELMAFTALKLQGAGAGRGRSLTGPDFDLTGTGVFARIYGAALRSAPQVFSAQNDRAGDFTWTGSRTFTAGVPGPVFFIGTGAPA